MRLDRLITLYLARPLLRLRDRLPSSVFRPPSSVLRLPILMYHSISESAENGVPAYYRTTTSPAVFRQHMVLLRELGYTGIDLERGLELIGKNQAPGRKYVVLTFDDGFRDFYTQAVPVLRELNFTASVFLPTAFIGDQGRSFKGVECLTWDEARACHRAGMHFGSHTVNHPILADLPWETIEREVKDSKAQIEQELREPVTCFAHPYAFPQTDTAWVHKLVEVLERAGYLANVTTGIGRVRAGDNLWLLRRLPANQCDDSTLLKAKLEGAYDWLHAAQCAIKQIKGLARRL